MPDLLTAAHGLTVVHYDADFETAATVVAFEQVWVAQCGSLLHQAPPSRSRVSVMTDTIALCGSGMSI
jgi:hypothetical protein